jgi:hypothetical protein
MGQDILWEIPEQTGMGRSIVPLSRYKEIFLSRCPFVTRQRQEQQYWDKLICSGTSRDRITFPKNQKNGKGHSKTRKDVLKQEIIGKK